MRNYMAILLVLMAPRRLSGHAHPPFFSFWLRRTVILQFAQGPRRGPFLLGHAEAPTTSTGGKVGGKVGGWWPNICTDHQRCLRCIADTAGKACMVRRD